MSVDVLALNEKIKKESLFISTIEAEAAKVIVGQRYMIERILIGLLGDGHILLEGLPGLAKTLAIKTVSDIIQTGFQRIQFTPDLLPSDLIGTMIFNQKTSEFKPKKGPIFTNLLLADEINRAPAKVQSALLEAMAEKQVTIGDQSYKLEEPFLVMATQNPIEQEGTYPLPEAQMDRFMLKVNVTYPSLSEEKVIMERMTKYSVPEVKPMIDPKQILKAREVISEIYIDEKIKDYILSIVFATREPKQFKIKNVEGLILVGASPRATIALSRAAKVHAFLNQRGYVTPEDIKAVAYDVIRHRIIVTYEAEAENISSEEIIKRILSAISVP